MSDTVGQRIRQVREHRMMTQRELSMASGVKVTTISRIENGGHPSFRSLRALIAGLDCDQDWLLHGDESGSIRRRLDRLPGEYAERLR